MNNMKKNQNIRKVLIIRFSSIGDIILTFPLLYSLRIQHPEIQIDFLLKKSFVETLSPVKNYISNIIPIDFKTDEFSYINLRKKILKNQYDLLIDLQNNVRSRRLTIGFSGKVVRYHKQVFRRWLYIHFGYQGYRRKSVAEKYAERLPIPNFKLQPFHLSSWPDEGEIKKCRTKVEAILRSPLMTFILLFPGAKHTTKRWPAEYFGKLIRLIREKSSVPILIHGDASERDLCQGIIDQSGVEAVNLAGLLTLRESFILTSLASLVISNDSAPMHMAALFQKPQIAIFGNTTLQFGFFPLNPNAVILENNDLPCRPCSHLGYPTCPKKHFRCMREILPEMVINAIMENYPSLTLNHP
jgi:lipopolysaccharide heptosyltransferase II